MSEACGCHCVDMCPMHAAAPEMYEALQKAWRVLNAERTLSKDEYSALMYVSMAINKVEGRS